MDRFSAPVQKDTGGSEIDFWFNQCYINNTSWTGDNLVQVVSKNGKLEKIPRKDVAILFNNYKVHRTGNTDITSYYSNVGSNGVTATPVGLVSGSDCFVAAFEPSRQNNHELTKKRKNWRPWLVQPVPIFTNNDELQFIRSQNVMQQNARVWVSSGANDIDMRDEHVANMLVSQQSSLIYRYSKRILQEVLELDEKSGLTMVREMMVPLLLHMESTVSYINISNETKMPIKGLCYADYAVDTLQRSISSYLTGYQLSKENWMRVVELSLRRTFKKQGYTADLTKIVFPGMVSTFNFYDLAVGYLKKELTQDQVTEQYYQRLKKIRADIDSFAGTDEDDVRANVFWQIMRNRLTRLDVTQEQFRKMYNWSHVPTNYLKEMPLVEFGLVKPIVTDFTYQTEELKQKNRVMYNTARVSLEADNKIQVVGKSPPDWTGIALETDGVYTISCDVIGDADSRKSHDWGLKYALNFTTGKEVLPINKALVTDHGLVYKKGSREEINQDSINLNKPFEVLIDNKHGWVYQNGRIFASMELKRSKLLLPFKNLILHIEYSPLPFNVDVKLVGLKRIINSDKIKYRPPKHLNFVPF